MHACDSRNPRVYVAMLCNTRTQTLDRTKSPSERQIITMVEDAHGRLPRRTCGVTVNIDTCACVLCRARRVSTETGRRPAGEAGRTLRAGGCVRCPCRTVTHAPCFNGHHFGTHGQVLSNVDRAVHRVVPHGGIVRAIHYVYLDLHGSGQGREALVLSHSLQLVRFSLAGKESMEKDKTTSLVVLKRGGGPGSPLRLIPTWLSHWSLRYPL